MRFIGDVHHKFGEYLYLTEQCEASIQVGDFGVGFAPVPDVSTNHRFIRGNHDDPGAVAQYNWIPDGHVEGPMFFLGGGRSIDQSTRYAGVDWWEDEELSIGQLMAMVDKYADTKPEVLVCHECPSTISPILFGGTWEKALFPSRTSQALSAMLEAHRPSLVIFGHWHMARDRIIDRTRFICLPELGWIDIAI